eukprot:7994376-Karenia_brevis.AAC.1
MARTASSKAKAQPQARARAKARAKGKAGSRRAQRQRQVQSSNARRAERTECVKIFNEAAAQVGLPQLQVSVWDATADDVERLVRGLETRLSDRSWADKVREAAQKWQRAGGLFSAPVLEVDLSRPPVVPLHRVLQPTFQLESKAFMLTYHSQTFTSQTWPSFRTFVISLKQKFGARAWAACLEESLNSAENGRHHLH